ncbi:transcriptional protein SWT1 [Syngnathus typhle]|uniref:transcriptional protein SWT1 n=1 Tax=Syngnathus typhle TaxID=161592 RepID=UPI002A6ADAD9|nr:transcriptional protein SWT1 [Syngnathus typhle]XP_061152608.1 transcriptional protein SWT1 [Syngnathus typhle]XP_061152609.1 transcriptional protein SWT1 [Syngnathus typhle]
MSGTSRRRKRKRSTKEDEGSKDQRKDDTSKRKDNENRSSSQCTKHTEGTARVEEESRQIKKAVYKLHTTEETDKRRVSQADVANKAEPPIANKDKVTSGSQIKQKSPSRSWHIRKRARDDRKEKKDSKYDSDEKSHYVSPPRLKKKQTSPSHVSAEQRKQCQDLLKSKCKELHKNQEESKTIKTEEQSQTLPDAKDSIRDKQTEIIQETSKKSPQLSMKEKGILDRRKSEEQFSHSSKPKVSFKIAKASIARPKIPTILHSGFKIPKKVEPEPVEANTKDNKNDVTATSRTATCVSEHSVSEAAANCLKHAHHTWGEKDKSSSLLHVPPTTSDVLAQQMQVAEELHLARSEKRLEVDVMQSYGELTCMDIDPPEESATSTLCAHPAQQNVILVLDTNILLSHLDYVKKMPQRGLGALGLPIVLIPWVVLQELDSLKKGKGLRNSVARLACPAISYIYNSLKRRERHLWGQSMQQAAESNHSLMAENNDDKVLQCCLQYQSLYPDCALILCTNDKNLCTKAVLSGVQALSKADLEAEVERSRHNPKHLQSNVLQRLPEMGAPMPPLMPGGGCTAAPSLTQERLSSCLPKEDSKSPRVEEVKNIERCVSELKGCLQEVLSNVLEMEMKASYGDLWQEIVYIKPPWDLLDILHCLKKHWIAVFGFIVPRPLLQTVIKLIDFFKRGRSRDRGSILVTIQEAKEFVKEFRKRVSLVPGALTAMNNIIQKLQPQPDSAVSDVVMNEDDEAKRPPSSHVPHQEVWAMFENIWCKVCEISMEVFKALAFDPHSRQSALSVGGPAPPQDAVVCLSQISSMVSQLLQAFIGVLCSSAGLREVQELLSTIRSNKMVDVNFPLADTDLLSCFSQTDYREKLSVGVNQLTELKEALDHCVQTTTQHVNLNM